LIERERLHIDELALTLGECLPLGRQERMVGAAALATLDEIGAVFVAMSGDQRTDVGVRSGAEWARSESLPATYCGFW